jgi:hypothetical protein
MRPSLLILLLLLLPSTPIGTTRPGAVVPKVEQSAADDDPCDDTTPGTVVCGRIRVPVG